MGIFDFLKKKNKDENRITNEKTKDAVDQVTTPPIKEGDVSISAASEELWNILEIKKHFFAFDVETTGLYHETDRIVEIGAVEFIDGVAVNTFNSLLNPHISIGASATQVNHITNEMISKAPNEEIVIKKFVDFLGEAIKCKVVIIAHNAKFDMSFLRDTLVRMGYDADISYIDTLSLSRKYVKGLSDHKQPTVAEHFGIVMDQAHRAASDALTCGKVFLSITECMKQQAQVQPKQANTYEVPSLNYAAPCGEELEVCAILQEAIQKRGGDIDKIRFGVNDNGYVKGMSFYSFIRFKTCRKGRYIIIHKDGLNGISLPSEQCTMSEGGAHLFRVYFSNPFDLEPIFDYVFERYKNSLAETEEFRNNCSSAEREIAMMMSRIKSISQREQEELIQSAKAREYEELNVSVEIPIPREAVSIIPNHKRCPICEIKNLDDEQVGFSKGYGLFEKGEMKRRTEEYEEALNYYDKAREEGLFTVELYEAYSKVYHSMKQYSDEIVILDEFLERNKLGHEGIIVSRQQKAIQLLYKEQNSEKEAEQHRLEKEKKKAEATRKKEEEAQKKAEAKPIVPIGKKVRMLDDDGNVINEFGSISEAARQIGTNQKSIRDAATGVQKHAAGYRWKYVDESEN